MLSQLLDNTLRIDEANLSAIKRKQASITRLFPTFPNRVRQVKKNGGVRFIDEDPGIWYFNVSSGTEKGLWYTVYIKFVNIKPMLKMLVNDRRMLKTGKRLIDYQKVADYILRKADIKILCGCLVGETEVILLDGRILSMHKILEEYGTNKEFWVYASDENGDFVPAKAKCAGQTGLFHNLVEVFIDNGKSVKCTPDHLFRMRDGTYKEAKDLKQNDSLMPLYLNESKPSGRYSQRYLKIKLNGRRGKDGRSVWKMVHRIVAETILKKSHQEKIDKLIETNKEKFLVVHHKDFNTLNNVPDNIEWLGKDEHWRYHAKLGENRISAFKKACEDEEFKKKMSKSNSKAGRICHIKNPGMWKKGNDVRIAFARSEEGRAICSATMKKTWQNKREAMMATNRVRSLETRKKIKAAWTPERRERARRWMSLLSRTLKRDSLGRNHKVVKIDHIVSDEGTPVYDLSVEKYHNFALASGIFVHNCEAFQFYGPAYILSLSKYNAKYTRRERRPPVIRNPKQYGAVCKHMHLVLLELSTMANKMAQHLRKFYVNDIKRYEGQVGRTRENVCEDIFKPKSMEEVIQDILIQVGAAKNDDGSYDVKGNVGLEGLGLTKIPIKFRHIDGNFYCGNNKLTSLENAPEKVGGTFDCDFNYLTSLEGAPREVSGYFDCSFNKLTSLEGAPKHVGGYFNCRDNNLTSLKGLEVVVGGIICFGNPVSEKELLATIGR